MKKLILFLTCFFAAICLIFIAISPDLLSTVITIVMSFAVFFGVLFGIVPSLLCSAGFKYGKSSIERAKEVNAENIWAAVLSSKPFFNQKVLDEMFDSYMDNVKDQKEKGIIISDIEDTINENAIAVRSWRGVVLQIAGILTSLGLLGTFLGLITGVSGVAFSSVEVTMYSIENLLRGITTAFYTSIIGVILSILFNIAYRLSWNVMLREMQVFTEQFHNKIQPAFEERIRAKQYLNTEKAIKLLDVIKNNSSISLNMSQTGTDNEQRMMFDILAGVWRGEFTFALEPVVDLSTKEILKAKSVRRWNHETLGEIKPSVYLPVVESNGYITKLDQSIWDNVCQTIRKWKDDGNSPVPIILDVSKTDILALDIPRCMSDLLDKYSLQPRDIEIAIDASCYMICADEAVKAESSLLKKGFSVCVYDFDGKFLDLGNTSADEVKLNLEKVKDTGDIKSFFDQARNTHINLTAENISSAKQLAELVKSGCRSGEGKHLYEEMTKPEFEKLMKYN